ncbi:MAG: WbqC family protein [Rubripirellula sp.]|nr:WbqC family protein [Rubripirellula sp.]
MTTDINKNETNTLASRSNEKAVLTSCDSVEPGTGQALVQRSTSGQSSNTEQMTKKVLITQSNYIPWKGYFDAISAVDHCVLYDSVQYTRRDWRNRNKIKTAQGLKWLTVPVDVKGKYHQAIDETRISDKDWPAKHWRLIQSNYRKSPCFDEVAQWLEPCYLDCDEMLLSDVNRRFLSSINQYLGIQTPLTFSSAFDLRGDRSEKLLNICLDLEADVYYSGPAAKSYLDEALFHERGVSVRWLDYSGYPEYQQLYGDFVHGVSIIDLLMMTGRDSACYMGATKRDE